jgi:hypothetical protein
MGGHCSARPRIPIARTVGQSLSSSRPTACWRPLKWTGAPCRGPRVRSVTHRRECSPPTVIPSGAAADAHDAAARVATCRVCTLGSRRDRGRVLCAGPAPCTGPAAGLPDRATAVDGGRGRAGGWCAVGPDRPGRCAGRGLGRVAAGDRPRAGAVAHAGSNPRRDRLGLHARPDAAWRDAPGQRPGVVAPPRRPCARRRDHRDGGARCGTRRRGCGRRTELGRRALGGGSGRAGAGVASASRCRCWCAWPA